MQWQQANPYSDACSKAFEANVLRKKKNTTEEFVAVSAASSRLENNFVLCCFAMCVGIRRNGCAAGCRPECNPRAFTGQSKEPSRMKFVRIELLLALSGMNRRKFELRPTSSPHAEYFPCSRALHFKLAEQLQDFCVEGSQLSCAIHHPCREATPRLQIQGSQLAYMWRFPNASV